jgi:hypothetical protein
MKKATVEFRMMLEHNRNKKANHKLETGSLAGLYPIVLDGGRTTIFISDLTREAEIRERYNLRRDSRLNIFTKKPKE